MLAIVLKENGVLKQEEVSTPIVSPNQVLVKVQYAALNHRDEWIRKGQYAKIQLPAILGSDGSGVVVTVANQEDAHWLHQQVIINPNQNWGTNPKAQQKEYNILGMPSQGTLAEYIAVPTDRIHHIPKHLSMEQAAALPLAGLTAYNACFNKAKIQTGNNVFISGVGGGVAQFAFQFAVAVGANVYVSSSKEQVIQQCIDRGAKGGINYNNKEQYKDVFKQTGGFDVVIDAACGNGMNDLLALLKPCGRYVFYGATRGLPENLNMRAIFWNHLQLLGSTMGSDQDFEQMLQFVANYQISPIIDKIINFTDAEQAFDRMHNGNQFGKIIVKVN